MKKNNPKVLNAWALYDWSNSVYNLVITTAIFPAYYLDVTSKAFNGDKVTFLGMSFNNEALYGYAISFSFLITAILSPLLSGIADYGGKKKLFMKVFTFLGAFACLSLFFFRGHNIEYGISMAILASVGYAGALVFYNAYLPQIATLDRVDSVSARGFALGYFGSVLLLIINLFMIIKKDLFGQTDELSMMRIAFLMVGLWWIGFSQITFYFLPKDRKPANEVKNLLSNGYQEIIKVWYKLKNLGDVRTYLIAFFAYSVGVQTVMLLAPTFAKKVIAGIESTDIIALVVLIQIVAIFGSYVFANLSRAKGNAFSIKIMLVIWFLICIAGYFITSKLGFYALGMVIGTVMGGIQSLSRSTYSKLIPRDSEDTTSFFSFFDVTEKMSIVIGTFLFSLIGEIFDLRTSILAMIVFFVIGIVVITRLKTNFKEKAE